jgi:hypothetical protein
MFQIAIKFNLPPRTCLFLFSVNVRAAEKKEDKKDGEAWKVEE